MNVSLRSASQAKDDGDLQTIAVNQKAKIDLLQKKLTLATNNEKESGTRVEELTKLLASLKKELTTQINEQSRVLAEEITCLKAEHIALIKDYRVALIEVQDESDINFKLGMYQKIYLATQDYKYNGPPLLPGILTSRRL